MKKPTKITVTPIFSDFQTDREAFIDLIIQKELFYNSQDYLDKTQTKVIT